ncbi:ArsD-related vicinal cysteine protein VcpD [Priestia filamentosa]|uniref:ArsD-related vicinal cysteine protein VcpD n=1 Tax=Priestia filamentosa TaxID=1402861 RepID=UPI0039828CB9
MNTSILIEIFPSVLGNQDECCDMDAEMEPGSSCCEDSENFYEESLELKERLKEHFDKAVNVHLYNYDISMDRVMAKKKLSELMRKRGFKHVSEDDILKYATPAVVVNGNLISFATKPQMETVVKEIS